MLLAQTTLDARGSQTHIHTQAHTDTDIQMQGHRHTDTSTDKNTQKKLKCNLVLVAFSAKFCVPKCQSARAAERNYALHPRTLISQFLDFLRSFIVSWIIGFLAQVHARGGIG